ncbi:MAG TPA: hypothetical protein VGI39_17085 [Polyangiaceae bacterium]|jgi:hypothetical protein
MNRPSAEGDDISVRILEVDGDHALGVLDNLLIIVWRHRTFPAAVSRASLALRALIEAHDSVGIMQIAEVTTKAPEGPARAAIGKMLADGKGHVVCSSLVYLGTGFWMASARAFVTGLTALSRPGFPHLVFGRVDEAADWHARLLGTMTRTGIASAVRTLTEALDRFGPPSRSEL